MRCLIVGQAKSGTTALLYAVAQAIGNPAIYFEERIAALADLPSDAAVKIIFEHENAVALAGISHLFDRKILLTRDCRDTAVSSLLYVISGKPDLLKDDTLISSFLSLLLKKQQHPATVSIGEILALLNETLHSFFGRLTQRALELGRFYQRDPDQWFLLPYEKLVAGDLQGLSAYLGAEIGMDYTIDTAYARVARTKGSGDWQHWFTPSDVANIASLCAPALSQLGYRPQWSLPSEQVIQPAHSWQYVYKLVTERRRHYGIQEYHLPDMLQQAFTLAQQQCIDDANAHPSR
jgi:hypothetical protein